MRQSDLAKAADIGQSSISKLERGEAFETAAIAKIARALRVPAAWLEVVSDVEPDWEGGGRPEDALPEPMLSLTVGRVALMLANACRALPDRTRNHVAHLTGEMIENGPDESQASAIDALATIDVSLPLPSSSTGQSDSPFRAESLDLDQDLAATLQDLAALSQTMAPTQLAAMVAALQGIKETSWDTTDDSSRKYIEREREMSLGPRQVEQPTRKARRS